MQNGSGVHQGCCVVVPPMVVSVHDLVLAVVSEVGCGDHLLANSLGNDGLCAAALLALNMVVPILWQHRSAVEAGSDKESHGAHGVACPIINGEAGLR